MAEAEDQVFTSNEESTEDSEDDDSEEEPKLKYERLSNGVTDILQKDAASCMTVHEKFLALGTHNGKVYLLDVQGNVTQKFEIVERRDDFMVSVYEGHLFTIFRALQNIGTTGISLSVTKATDLSNAFDWFTAIKFL